MPRYVRFTLFGKPSYGLAQDEGVRPLAGDPFDGGRDEPQGEVLPWDVITLRPPTSPTKIVAVGRNYVDHAKELGNDVPKEPLLFLKPPSCLVAHGDDVVYPEGESELVHHEGELALVIGRRARHVSEADAAAHILGYTIMNDVTARDLQRRDVQFTRAKSFDTFGPLGPWLDTDFVPASQRLTVHVNGELRQDGRVDQMVFQPAMLVAYVSRIMTLEPGDVITTGTPAGVGPLVPGDRVVVAIEGLGELENGVVGG
ncbi:MAG: fumarylacetoacetate hydrolase family protein [Myxococcales bacterium]|nr:fumarylacetoacetate hydrolase family protein [Myxococcales bacterium]